MAFLIYASVGSTTLQLNDGSPFRMESAEGLSGMDVIRHQQSGPLQDGATNLGFRLLPRLLTLKLVFHASTAAILDSYRTSLMDIFKPLGNITTFLSVQRDDNAIRTLRCFRVGEIEVELVPEDYAGKLHRATLRLRAASPLWNANSATLGTATAGSVAAVNSGDVYAYPVMTLQGPAVNPVITNSAGGTISLSGYTLGTSQVITIDLRDGNKRVYDSSNNNLLGSVANPVNLASFAFAPAPVVAGGTNVITLTASGTSGSTQFVVQHTNQYMSF